MFHTYVLAASGKVVDFDRASFLMDDELLAQAKSAMQEEKLVRPDRDPAPPDSPLAIGNGPRDESDWAQWVWGYYCARHYEKYDEPFIPDANPDWDS